MAVNSLLNDLPFIKQENEDLEENADIEFDETTLNTFRIKDEPMDDEDDDLDILNNQKYPFLATILRPKVIPAKHHEARYEECNICGKTVKYLEKHLESHEGGEPVECNVCGKKVKHLDKHMDVHREAVKPVRCTLCCKKVKYLDRHMEMHENKKYACIYCRKVFTRKCYIQTHIRDKHKGMPFETMEVDDTFVQQRIKEELTDPDRIAKCTCTLCGTVCKTSKGLTNHLWQKHKKFTSLSDKPQDQLIKDEPLDDLDAVANFKCSFCGILCKTSQSLTTHLFSKHNKTAEENIEHAHKLAKANEEGPDPDEVHQCKECGIVCKTAKTLSNHQQYKHMNESCMCDHCGKVFACKPYLKLHVRLMHQPVKLIKCTLCDELFKRKSSLSRHMKTHLPKSQRVDKQFPCDHCSENFNTKRDLQEHVKFAHKALNCFMCDEVFFTKVEFGKHVITHSDYEQTVELRPYACDICGKRFQIKAYCNSHKALQHTSDGNSNKCVDCGKEFLNAVLLKKHRRNHQRKYKCHLCNITCLRKAKLDRHIAIHMADTPFKCKICNASFQARVALNSHLRWHAAQKKNTGLIQSNSTLEGEQVHQEIFSNLSSSGDDSSFGKEIAEEAVVNQTPCKIEESEDDKMSALLIPKVVMDEKEENNAFFPLPMEKIKEEGAGQDLPIPFAMPSPGVVNTIDSGVFPERVNYESVPQKVESTEAEYSSLDQGVAEYTCL